MTDLKFKEVKDVFDHFVNPSLKIDNKFITDCERWLTSFQRKNAEHVAFFSSALFGYHIPKWLERDDEYWLFDVLEIDENEVAEYVYQCPYFDKDHAVSSNVLSIGLLYLMHRIEIERSLSDKQKDHGKVVLMQVLTTKYITSLIYKYFNRGSTSLENAMETYNRLSRRFDLKDTGSWSAFIKRRSENMALGEFTKKAKYEKQLVFQTFDNEQVVRKLNAVKSNLNRAMVEINDVFRQVLMDKDKTKLTNALSMGEDGLYVRDLSNHFSEYLSYQTKIMQDKQAFIKYDLLEVIEASLPTISVAIFRESLEWIFDMQEDRKHGKVIAEMREMILQYSLELMQEEEIGVTNLTQVAYRLRQNFVSGKANDSRLVKCRKVVDNLIIAYRPKSKGKVITSERTAIMMYLVMRPLARNYYS